LEKSKEAISEVKKDLGHKLGDATTTIKILNSKPKEELKDYEIEDKTETILEIRRILTKRNLMLQLENKCHNLEVHINKFHKKFNVLHQKGLPGLRGIGYRRVPLEEYQRRLHSIAIDNSKFVKIKGTITRKAFIEGLSFALLIQHEIKHLFIVKPTFQKYTEVDETYKKLIKFSIPDEERWEKICQLID